MQPLYVRLRDHREEGVKRVLRVTHLLPDSVFWTCQGFCTREIATIGLLTQDLHNNNTKQLTNVDRNIHKTLAQAKS